MELDPYIIDTLLPDLVGHDRHPSAFLVYLFLYRRSGDGRQGLASVSLKEITEGTGLSKRAVQVALKRLVRRRLVTVHRRSITATGEYRIESPWTLR